MTRPESKMSDSERRLRIAMLDHKISRLQLAQELGVKVTTLGNIIRGSRCSPALKKKIQAALGVRIWEDTPVELRLDKNVEFVFPTVKHAADFIDQCEREIGPRAVFRRSARSRTVGFLKDLVFVKDQAESASSSPSVDQDSKNRKISASSVE
jgi:transcriptional regulator with XRE-family HTH domain